MAEVFRKKALERRATPDHLDDYINVSNPGVWFVLAAIVAFLLGVAAWGVFGRVNEVQAGVVRVQGGAATLFMDQTLASDLNAGDAVEVSGVKGSVVSVSEGAVRVSSLSEEEQGVLSASGNWAAQASLSIELPDGTYRAEVTLVSINPVELLFNSKA